MLDDNFAKRLCHYGEDDEHLSFFCGGCRYRVKASVSDIVGDTKRRLYEGGLGKGGDMTTAGR